MSYQREFTSNETLQKAVLAKMTFDQYTNYASFIGSYNPVEFTEYSDVYYIIWEEIL